MNIAVSDAEKKKKIVLALDEVSLKLGNTRTVCKKYYVHPGIIRLYEEDKLHNFLQELDAIEEPDRKTGYTKEEIVLINILEKLSQSNS
jgi:DNA topoisomerase-1